MGSVVKNHYRIGSVVKNHHRIGFNVVSIWSQSGFNMTSNWSDLLGESTAESQTRPLFGCFAGIINFDSKLDPTLVLPPSNDYTSTTKTDPNIIRTNLDRDRLFYLMFGIRFAMDFDGGTCGGSKAHTQPPSFDVPRHWQGWFGMAGHSSGEKRNPYG